MKQLKILLILSILCVIGFIVFISMKSEGQDSAKILPFSPTPTITQLPTVVQKPQFIIKGSIPYWDQESAFSTFRQNFVFFSYINLFWYYVDNDGIIKKYQDAYEDKSIIDFAHAKNVKVLAVVTNLSDEEGSTWDSSRVEIVIKNKTTRDKHIENIKNQESKFN